MADPHVRIGNRCSCVLVCHFCGAGPSLVGVSDAGAMKRRWSTRLVTRTKESNTCASVRVANLGAEWKQRATYRLPEVGRGRALCGALFLHHRPTWIFLKGLSQSVFVGTRKIVNYGWPGRSQRKLWWRSEVILTCKSFIWVAYRGERLIEQSSSWFPPKFPSG